MGGIISRPPPSQLKLGGAKSQKSSASLKAEASLKSSSAPVRDAAGGSQNLGKHSSTSRVGKNGSAPAGELAHHIDAPGTGTNLKQPAQQATQETASPAGQQNTQQNIQKTPVQPMSPGGTKAVNGVKSPNSKSSERESGVLWIIRPTNDINEMFKFGEKLGEGRFGVTHTARYKVDGKIYACKSVSKKKLNSPQEVKDIQLEIEVMHHLVGNEGVVGLQGAYEDRNYVHIVMELCAGGDLFHAITSRHHYSERDASSMLRSILSTLGYCHTMGVLHRDLKPENFLLSDTTSHAKIKFADFGLSTFFKEGELFNDVVGSPYYMAPEVLRRKYSKEADVWSCGVILYILLCGSPPFYGKDEREIFKAVLEKTPDTTSGHWARVSAGAKDCLARMLVRDPHRRATIEELLQHRWLLPNGSASGEPLNLEIVERLRKFTEMNALKKHALQVMVGLLPKEETAGLQQFFEELDADGNGFVTQDELKAGLAKKGGKLPENELKQLLAMTDIDGDGVLDYKEFLAATVHKSKLHKEDLILKAFKYFDADNSGYITRDELIAALGKGGMDGAQLDAILAEVDRDDDGRIDYEEFSHMLRAADADNFGRSVPVS